MWVPKSHLLLPPNPDLETLHQNGENAVPLGMDTFAPYIAENEYVFANFYAPWCIWCQRLAPTWEAFAEAIEAQKFGIKVVKIDCVVNRDLCAEVRGSLGHGLEGWPRHVCLTIDTQLLLALFVVAADLMRVILSSVSPL